MTLRNVYLLMSVPALALAAGCGSGDETTSYSLVSVSGTVTLDGKPLEGAEVTFTPEKGNKPDTPGGDRTGKEGNYKAMYRGRSGLAPGKYTVVVSKMLTATESAALPDEIQQNPAAMALAQQGAMIRAATQARAKRVKTAVINASFNDRVVDAGGSVLDFDVKAK